MGQMMIRYFSWICQRQKLFSQAWNPKLTFLLQNSKRLEACVSLVITMMDAEVGPWKLNVSVCLSMVLGGQCLKFCLLFYIDACVIVGSLCSQRLLQSKAPFDKSGTGIAFLWRRFMKYFVFTININCSKIINLPP